DCVRCVDDLFEVADFDCCLESANMARGERLCFLCFCLLCFRLFSCLVHFFFGLLFYSSRVFCCFVVLGRGVGFDRSSCAIGFGGSSRRVAFLTPLALVGTRNAVVSIVFRVWVCVGLWICALGVLFRFEVGDDVFDPVLEDAV